MVETTKITAADLERIDGIVARYQGQKWSLLPLLQEIQGAFGYIPPEAVQPVSAGLGLFPSQVQGVITFYSQFYTTPRGKNVVRVCRGTACHVRGGKTILKLVKQELGIEEGETSPDWQYTLETVACIGVCSLAPNMVINQTTYGHLNPRKVSLLLNKREK